MDMNNILKTFIRAQCLGNLEMHLSALSDKLPYFVKSVHVYLQQMGKLIENQLYEEFMNNL